MKRVCKRKVMIDALTVCFEVENRYHFDRISELDFGDMYDLDEFQLVRVEGNPNLKITIVMKIAWICHFPDVEF